MNSSPSHSCRLGDLPLRWLCLFCVLVFSGHATEEAKAGQTPASVRPRNTETGEPGLRYYGASHGALAQSKARLAAGDPALRPAYDQLLAEVDQALRVKPPTVMDKAKPGASGDKHDYASQGPYWWPDPTKPDGLPYVSRDGVINPESRTDASDQMRIELLGRTVGTLALAYYFTGREEYAEHAARCLRVWFLDPATKMNPHFKQGQAVPGRNTGRAIGIIEIGGAVEAIDASALLAVSPAWSAADAAALKAWTEGFLDWLVESEMGREEAAMKQNHGTIYDANVTRLALHVGRNDLARRIIEEAKLKRIAVQIEPDGRQPLELRRTKSFNYSLLNLGGLVQLADYGKRLDVGLWHFATEDGRSIRGAIEFLLPYVIDPDKPWPYDQIEKINRLDRMSGILRRAAIAYGEERYAKLVASMPGAEPSRMQLTHPMQAVAASMRAAAGADGFVPLFNGKDLSGWTIKLRNAGEALARKVFVVEDGVIHVFRDLPDGYELDTGGNATHGMIYTTRPYRNFIFRFDYKWGSKRLNNFTQFQYDAGCYYHVIDDKIWPVGLEYQVRFNHLENRNHTGDFWSPGKTVIHWTSGPEGAFLPADQGGVAQTPRRGEHRALAPAPFHGLDGEWNRCEVIVMGGAFAIHKLNGVIVNIATDLTPSEGLIGLQSETAEVFYRNIEIKEFAEPVSIREFLR